jgi:hypothetical protein
MIPRNLALDALADIARLDAENGGRLGGGPPEIDLDPPDRTGRRRRGGPATVSVGEGPGGARRIRAVEDLNKPDGRRVRGGGCPGAQLRQQFLSRLPCGTGGADPFGAKAYGLPRQAFSLPSPQGVAKGRTESSMSINGDGVKQGRH